MGSFSRQNLQQMRAFYQLWPLIEIRQTASGEFDSAQTLQAASAISPVKQLPTLADIVNRFPLPWSAYARRLSVKSDYARQFHETEALRDYWPNTV